MNDDTIQDLKQFIATTVSQQASGLRDDIRNDIRQDIREDIREEIGKLDKKLSKKIDDLSLSVGEAMDSSNEVIDLQLQNHEKRITRLEKKTA